MKTLIALLCVLCLATGAGAQYFEHNSNFDSDRRDYGRDELREQQYRLEQRQREQQAEIDRLRRLEAERQAERNRARDYPFSNARCPGNRSFC